MDIGHVRGEERHRAAVQPRLAEPHAADSGGAGRAGRHARRCAAAARPRCRDDQDRRGAGCDRPTGAPAGSSPSPRSSACIRNWRSSKCSSTRPSSALLADDALANAGRLEIIPLQQPLTLFVWSKSRVVPVRLTDFSITEEAFDPEPESDSRQGQPRHARAERRRHRVLASGRTHLHELSHEQAAAGVEGHVSRAVGARSGRAAMKSPLQAMIQMGFRPSTSPPTAATTDRAR